MFFFDRLLRNLPTYFNKNPIPVRAFNVSYDGFSSFLYISNNEMYTSVQGGSGEDFVLNLLPDEVNFSFTIEDVYNFINTLPGYSATDLNTDVSWMGAFALLETSAGPLDLGNPLGNQVTTFSNQNYQILHVLQYPLMKAKSDLSEALRNLNLVQSNGFWADLWGQYFGMPRGTLAGNNETDEAYTERIIFQVITPQVNNVSMSYLLARQMEVLISSFVIDPQLILTNDFNHSKTMGGYAELKAKSFTVFLSHLDSFDLGSIDDVSNNNNVSSVATNITFSPRSDYRYLASAANFDGSTSQIVFPSIPEYDLGALPQLSIEAWVNPSVQANSNFILGFANGVVSLSLTSTGAVKLVLTKSDNTTITQISSFTVPTSTWTHVAVSWQQDNGAGDAVFRFFLNGHFQYKNLVPGVFKLLPGASALNVGSDGTNFFNGSLDEPRIDAALRLDYVVGFYYDNGNAAQNTVYRTLSDGYAPFGEFTVVLDENNPIIESIPEDKIFAYTNQIKGAGFRPVLQYATFI